MQQMLNTALMIAAKAHDGQFDKAGKPYIFHVLAVMHKLRSNDEELNCIALLHDVIEDTNTTYLQLRGDGMSERVIEAVKLLTKVPGQTADEYLEGILTSRDAMLVKKSDLQHNMDMRRLKGVTEKDLARMNKYIKMYHVIDEKLKEPVKVVSKVDNRQNTYYGFTKGDVCRFTREPRNAHGELCGLEGWGNYIFILDDVDHDMAAFEEAPKWVGFDLVTPDMCEDTLMDVRSGKYTNWLGWVRTDDIEKVHDQ